MPAYGACGADDSPWAGYFLLPTPYTLLPIFPTPYSLLPTFYFVQTIVQPGADTLQVALDAATAGDELVLEDGIHAHAHFHKQHTFIQTHHS